MEIMRRVREQLILSRKLLTMPDTPGLTLSDLPALAHDLIVCYGAADLALAAICVQLECVPDRKYICLPDYFDSLQKRAHAKGAGQEVDYVGELHAVRSNAQLRALPVDPRRWSRAKKETLEHVARWCQEFLGLGLFELDSVAVLPPAKIAQKSAVKEHLGALARADPEKRRFECSGSADIHLGLVGPLDKGRIANLSPGGCYVQTGFAFEVGEKVEMTLHMNKMSVRVTGKVVHVPSVAVGDRKAAFPGIGVQFTNMSAGARTRLEELIGDLRTRGDSRVIRRTARS
jgi:Tfp pilus assembly protein PilZ